MGDEDIPTRSPITTGPAPKVSTQDENDYSTLISVKEIFDEAIEGLSKDFNAFDLAKDAPKLEAQVAGRQIAYEILAPIQEQLRTAIDDIKEKQKG